MSLSLKAFERNSMKNFLKMCYDLTYVPKVALVASDLFTPGVKLPQDSAVGFYINYVQNCKKCPTYVRYYGYCRHCQHLMNVSSQYINIVVCDPAYLTHQFVSLETFLGIPHLPLGLAHYRRVKGKHLVHALFLQHNIRRLLLGLGLRRRSFPPDAEWYSVLNEFVNRQRTTLVSRICRGLAPLGLHTHVIYQIVVSLVPPETTRTEIMRVVCAVIDYYGSRPSIKNI